MCSSDLERRHRPGPFDCAARHRTAQREHSRPQRESGAGSGTGTPPADVMRNQWGRPPAPGVKVGGPCQNTVSRPNWGRSMSTWLNGTHQRVGWSAAEVHAPTSGWRVNRPQRTFWVPSASMFLVIHETERAANPETRSPPFHRGSPETIPAFPMTAITYESSQFKASATTAAHSALLREVKLLPERTP